MSRIAEVLDAALDRSTLLDTAHRNILQVLSRPDCEEWERLSIAELTHGEHWTELNDRFYRTLEFGTGGIRGRTIGRFVTKAEQGQGSVDVPEHPAAGTNTMNFYTVSTATRGLLSYLVGQFHDQLVRVAIAYDTRLFSYQFARLAAEIVAAYGGTAYLFDRPSPTPELSFAVRELKTHAGIVITASHNPSHDNGYKVYDKDGAQITEPQASAIIAAVAAVPLHSGAVEPGKRGTITPIDATLDDAYMAALKRLILCPEVFDGNEGSLRVVYTPLHGTGTKVVSQTLEDLGVEVILVPEQAVPDGRFPTLTSPNPENRETLSMAIALAQQKDALAALATDPDCDRLAVAVKTAHGQYEYLSGNQIGTLLAHYRLQQLFRLGILTSQNANHAALIKTFVTTQLLNVIAAAHGVKCIETLTGFKYIGAKLREYEELVGGRRTMSATEWRTKLLESSTYCVLAAEESLGYIAEDYVRDKDAAGAAVMFVELLASTMKSGTSVIDILNQIYIEYGYYGNRLGTLTFEGEDGLRKMNRILASYESEPPQVWSEKQVLGVRNFATHDFLDPDGTRIPREMMLIFDLADTCSVTVRASGTEPKIKFYFSAEESVESAQDIARTKERVTETMEQLWSFAKLDVEARLSG
jgi:phosphoglucomutase